MDRLFRPTMLKILLTLALPVVSFGIVGTVYRLTGSIWFGSIIFFPLAVYQWVRPIFRQLGVQDVMVGDCLIPACDQVSGAIAILVSLAIYYVVASIILGIVFE